MQFACSQEFPTKAIYNADTFNHLPKGFNLTESTKIGDSALQHTLEIASIPSLLKENQDLSINQIWVVSFVQSVCF